jgi:SAM-dependent methyltransferase
MEMAAAFPEATVIGTDLVLPTPALSLGQGLDQLPTNVRFLQDDFLTGLPFPDATFDFVYIRLLYDAVPAHAWPQLLQDLIRVTRPGGWVESLEALPYSAGQGEGMVTIIEWFTDYLRQRGQDPLVALKIPHLLRDGGLINITTREIEAVRRPTEGWEERKSDRESGLLFVAGLQELLVTAGIASADDYEHAAAQARLELNTSAQPGGFHTYVTYAQRAP